MNDDTIKIKCPFDGAVLTVKYFNGIETRSVTCPSCKHTYPFTQYKRIAPVTVDEDPATDLGEEKTSYKKESPANYILGKVQLVGSDTSWLLKPGVNTIGRQASNSDADIQINTGGKRSMSRSHIVIEIKKVPGKGFVHYLSLYKEKVNKTYIGNEELIFGDVIVLKHGDIIKLPDASLKFIIPDEEGTDF